MASIGNTKEPIVVAGGSDPAFGSRQVTKIMKPKVIGIGEFLWDVLPSGPRMGGAPANFACHAHALGAVASVISRVGADESGKQLVRQLAERGVSTEGIIEDPDHPTGTVRVKLGADGQPCFEISPDVAWDHIAVTPGLERLVADADAICFGTLGQRNPASGIAVRRLVESAPAGALRVFDANLRQNHYNRETIEASLELADVFKLNDEELPVISTMFGLHGETRDQLEELVSRFLLKLVVYTRGAQGSVLADGVSWVEHPGVPAVVRDTIGAGDSFTCAVTLGLILGWPLPRIAQCASEIAAFVCSHDGAIPELPDPLKSAFLTERLELGGRV